MYMGAVMHVMLQGPSRAINTLQRWDPSQELVAVRANKYIVVMIIHTVPYPSVGNINAVLCRNASRIIHTGFGRIVEEQQLLAKPTCGLVPLLPTSLQQQVGTALAGIPEGKRLSWLETLVWYTNRHTVMHGFLQAVYVYARHASRVVV